MSFYPDNTLSSFTTRLPNSIDLDGDWEVGLVEIQYPHNWYNVPKDEGRIYNTFFISTPQDFVGELWIDPGYYPSVEKLVETIEHKMNNATNRTVKRVKWYYSPITGKVKVLFHEGMQFRLVPHMQRMLGLHSDIFDVSSGQTLQGEEITDLDPIDSMYVYCDVVEPRVVGDSLVPLLRIVPVEGEHNDLVTRIYENVHYVRLQRKSFEAIEINIRDRTGQKVPFERGTLNVTLHFRQRKRLSTL